MKKAERRRIDAFELWCWRRLLRVPWTERRSNQSNLKINPGISLEGMMLMLKLQYFGHLMWRVDTLEKTLMLGGIGGRRRRGRQRVRWHHRLDGHEFEWTPGLVMDREAWHAAVQGVAKSWTELSNWTELFGVRDWLFLILYPYYFYFQRHGSVMVNISQLARSHWVWFIAFTDFHGTNTLALTHFKLSISFQWKWSLK